MKREALEKLLTDAGLTDSKPVLDEIMRLHGKTVASVQTELDTANGKITSLNTDLTAAKAEAQNYKTVAESKQTEIDKAVNEAKQAVKKELETKYVNEKTAEQRARARESVLSNYNDEQKGIIEALIKDDELRLSEDGKGFANFDELLKPVEEKYPTLFPKDPLGQFTKSGLPDPAKKTLPGGGGDPFNLGLIPDKK